MDYNGKCKKCNLCNSEETLEEYPCSICYLRYIETEYVDLLNTHKDMKKLKKELKKANKKIQANIQYIDNLFRGY